MKKLLVSIAFLSSSFFIGDAAAGVVCGWGTVMGQLQQVCWWEDDPPGGGGGGGGGGGDGGGGGGIGDGQGVWVAVNNGNEVNVLQRKVRNTSLGCTDELVILQGAVQSYLVKAPWLPRYSIVTLLVGGGSQQFVRTEMAGSLQFQPYSQCS